FSSVPALKVVSGNCEKLTTYCPSPLFGSAIHSFTSMNAPPWVLTLLRSSVGVPGNDTVKPPSLGVNGFHSPPPPANAIGKDTPTTRRVSTKITSFMLPERAHGAVPRGFDPAPCRILPRGTARSPNALPRCPEGDARAVATIDEAGGPMSLRPPTPPAPTVPGPAV